MYQEMFCMSSEKDPVLYVGFIYLYLPGIPNAIKNLFYATNE